MLKPKHTRIKTHVKGWMDEKDNVGYDEQIAVTTKLKNKDIYSAKIILDLGNETVVRNAWNNNKNYFELFSYFNEKYKSELAPAINQLNAKSQILPEAVQNNQLTTNETISSSS